MRLHLLAGLFAALLAAPSAAQLDPGGGLRDPAGGLRSSPLAEGPHVDASAARVEALTANLTALAEQMAAGVAGLEASGKAQPVAPGPEASEDVRKRYQEALASWQLERQDLLAELQALQTRSVARERELARIRAPSPEQQAEVKRAIESARRVRERVQAALAGAGGPS
jgi:hypothetical protein